MPTSPDVTSNWRLPPRRLMSVFLSTGLAVAGLLSSSGTPVGCGSTQGARTTVAAAASPRHGLWYAIGDEPTAAEVAAAPSRYGVVVLNPWDTWALQRIKKADPSVVVLAYKDLSSTRSYHVGPLPPTGVGAREAESHPSWFALDTAGHRIEWDRYPGHWQMAVWDTDYQERWTSNVLSEVVANGWDGVLADNDLTSLGWYDSALLAGTASSQQTDAQLRAGLDSLVTRAGGELRAHGKLLVPNLSDARLFQGRWATHAASGGAMEEAFVHWGTAADAGLWDWGPTGWLTQTAELRGPGLTLAVTRAARGDTRSLVYGYASVLVRGDESDFWTASTTAAGDYTQPEGLEEMSVPLGAPVGEAVRTSAGAWTRSFSTGWAAVNPTLRTVVLTPPKGTVDARGAAVRTVTLRPESGAVLRVGRLCTRR